MDNKKAKLRRRRHRRARSTVSPGADLGHLRDLVGYAIRRAQIVVFRHFRKSFAAHKIRPIQYGVLTVVGANPGLKQSEVCTALGIKRANFVGILNELERRRLIERRSAKDQRVNALYLTRAGKSLIERLRQINKAHEREVAAGLTSNERVRLIKMLNRISKATYADL